MLVSVACSSDKVARSRHCFGCLFSAATETSNRNSRCMSSGRGGRGVRTAPRGESHSGFLHTRNPKPRCKQPKQATETSSRNKQPKHAKQPKQRRQGLWSMVNSQTPKKASRSAAGRPPGGREERKHKPRRRGLAFKSTQGRDRRAEGGGS